MRNAIGNSFSSTLAKALFFGALLVLAVSFSAGSAVIATETATETVEEATTETGAQVSESSQTKTTDVSPYGTKTTASGNPLSGYVAGESVFPSFLKITLALIAVIAGIYLTLTLLKKVMGRKISSGGSANAIQIIETCYLAPKRSISLVRIGSRGALLSVADNTIETLMELSPDETNDILEKLSSQSDTPDFRKTLSIAKQKIIDLSSYALKNREESRVEQVSVK